MGKKEKRFLIAFIIVCVLLPFGMVRSPIEMVSHVFPLWGCYYGFVGWWAYTGKPFWQALLACYGIASLGIIGIYLGISIIQSTFVKIKNYFRIENIKNGKSIADTQIAFRSMAERVENDGKKFSLFLFYLRCLGVALKASGIFFVTLAIYGVWLVITFLKKVFSKFKSRFRKPPPCSKSQKKKITKKKKNNKSKRLARWLGKGSIGLILFVLFFPFPWSDPIATMAMKIKGTKYGLWYLLAVNIPHVYLIVWLAYKGIETFVF